MIFKNMQQKHPNMNLETTLYLHLFFWSYLDSVFAVSEFAVSEFAVSEFAVPVFAVLVFAVSVFAVNFSIIVSLIS
jgi:hypothetical protein